MAGATAGEPLREFASALCSEAVAISRRGPRVVVASKRDPFDLVTSVDRAIEERLRSLIERCFPDHAILGEEEGLSKGASDEWMWVVDPIDGTFNFATGLGPSACSVAVLNQNRPTVGAIGDFTTGAVYSATAGCGLLHRGDHAIEPPDIRTEAREHSLFLEFGAERLDRHLTDALGLFVDVAPVVPRLIGSAAAALLATALHGGTFAGIGLRNWDVTAGVLLAEERGHVVWQRTDQEDVHVLVGPRTVVGRLSLAMEKAVDLWLAYKSDRS